jgi:hypothetical protein
MEIDDAIAFIVDFLRNPRPSSGYSTAGYDLTLQIIVIFYLREVEKYPEYIQQPQDCPGGREISVVFFEAAWELCRRGILRPGVRSLGEQGTTDGSGYSLTRLGQRWIKESAPELLFGGPDRVGKLFEKLSDRFGSAFSQRASEAAHCHAFGQYVACCAMCGAATESIVLAVAIAKSDDEAKTLAIYRAAHGRHKVINGIVGQAKPSIAEQFRAATNLLSYWRDEAAMDWRQLYRK